MRRGIYSSPPNTFNGGLEISFKDNGGGIEDSIRNRIFEPYFTTKHQSVGTGIGAIDGT